MNSFLKQLSALKKLNTMYKSEILQYDNIASEWP